MSARNASPGQRESSHQRLYHDAMFVAADHDARMTPPAVLVEMPPRLDPLYRCRTLVARRRGKRDQLGSGHGSVWLFLMGFVASLLD
jgi:hypothetical protein